MLFKLMTALAGVAGGTVEPFSVADLLDSQRDLPAMYVSIVRSASCLTVRTGDQELHAALSKSASEVATDSGSIRSR